MTKSKRKETLKLKQSQIETLAETLSLLPKTISPKAIFTQMEKLEEQKKLLEGMIRQHESDSLIRQEPITYESYRQALSTLSNCSAKERVVRTLVRKIEISPDRPDRFKLHYFVGESDLEKGLAAVVASSDPYISKSHLSVRPLLTNGVTDPWNNSFR